MNRSFVQWMNYTEVIIGQWAILGCLVLIHVLIEKAGWDLFHWFVLYWLFGTLVESRARDCEQRVALLNLSETRGITFCEFNFCVMLLS